MEQAPSTGKTVALAGTLPFAVQHLLGVVCHDVWNFAWFTPDVSSDIMIIALGLTGLLMHKLQRKNENAKVSVSNGIGTP